MKTKHIHVVLQLMKYKEEDKIWNIRYLFVLTCSVLVKLKKQAACLLDIFIKPTSFTQF